MSGFLTNLAARARGTVPRLEPRKPAPYEAFVDHPMAPVLDTDLGSGAPLATVHPDGSHAVVSTPLGVSMPVARHAASQTSGPSGSQTQAAQAPSQPMRRATAILPSAVSLPGSMPQAGPATTPLVTAPVVPTPPLPTVKSSAPVADNSASSAKTSVVAHQAPPQPATPIAVPPPAALLSAIALTPEPDTPPSDTRRPQKSEVSTMLPDWSDTKRTSAENTHPEASPSLLTKVALALNPTRSAPNHLDGPLASETPEAPQIEVHIGTIEVVTDTLAAPMAHPVMAPSRSISLDDFLDGGG